MIVAEFGEWLCNGRPPWAAYLAMMSGRLIAVDKCPGIRPVGIGETWRCLLAKCLLQVTGQEAKAACGTEQLTGGWRKGLRESYTPCVCCGNSICRRRSGGFSSLTRGMRSMRRTVQPSYGISGMSGPGCAQFTFNFYRHWATLVVRDTTNGSGHLLLIKVVRF